MFTTLVSVFYFFCDYEQYELSAFMDSSQWPTNYFYTITDCYGMIVVLWTIWRPCSELIQWRYQPTIQY
jgi:hypothetical protein